MKEKFSLKDALFNAPKVSKIATEIKAVYPRFDDVKFCDKVVGTFTNLELKERIYWIRDQLAIFLPDDFQDAVSILIQALPPALDPTKKDDDFGDFIYAPYSDYIATYGCTKEHLDFSLDALCQINKRFSVEFAIRHFINNFPEETFNMLQTCACDSHYHNRRLASEGLRPKLPWAQKIYVDYRDSIKILDLLFSDTTRYVTRSVANHLNDISKINPTLVLETLQRWQRSNQQSPKEMDFIINHSLRTLVKQGNLDALLFLGYQPTPNIQIKNFSLKKSAIYIGETLEFDFEIQAFQDEHLIIDYIIHFQTKSDTPSPKVHKIKKCFLTQNEIYKITKKHPFKANMSTRKLYPGEHKIELQINGKIYHSTIFQLKNTQSINLKN